MKLFWQLLQNPFSWATVKRSTLLIFPLMILSVSAKADGLQIVYNVSQNQTALVGAGFTTVIFTGSITNTSNAPITFDTVGSGPVTPDPYVAGFVGAFPYPGITLNPGQSTGIINLATVTLNPFDPSLTYPSTLPIVFEAVVPSGPGAGNIIAENDVTITAVTSVAEPASLLLLTIPLLGLGILSCKWEIAKGRNLA